MIVNVLIVKKSYSYDGFATQLQSKSNIYSEGGKVNQENKSKTANLQRKIALTDDVRRIVESEYATLTDAKLKFDG